jgi:hypothetical protein
MIKLKRSQVITITGSALSSGTAWWIKSGAQDVLIGSVNGVTPLVLGPYINESIIDVRMDAGTYAAVINGEGDQVPTLLSSFVGSSSSSVDTSSPVNNGGSISQNGMPKVNLGGFGDSRTFLDQAVGVSTLPPYTTTYRFTNGVLSKAQSLTYELYNWKYLHNAGVSGDTAQGLDTRKNTVIPRMMAQRPANEEWDFVYWVDINDAIAGITSATFLGYFYTTMRYMLEQGIRNIFVLSGLPYPYPYSGETLNQHNSRIALIQAYNAGMKAFCAITPGLTFIDTYADYGGGLSSPDVPNPSDGTTDIHPGSIGADRIAKNLATAMIAKRGKNQLPAGKSLNQNPKLIGVENILNSGTTNNWFCSTRSAGVTNVRDATDGSMLVTLDATDGVNKTFNVFSNSTSPSDPLMPGDVVQGFIDCEHVAVTGLPSPVNGKIQANSGGFVEYINAIPGYSKGVLTGLGRQLFVSDPFTIPAGAAGVVMQPYLNSSATANTLLQYKVWDCSCRRIFVTPNAEYSANALIPPHRKNIRVLSNTAAGSFTLQLPPLAYMDDGAECAFEDVEGNASTKTLTVRGGTIDYYAAAWTISTAYALGAVVANGGNWYICTQAGTSAGSGGPSGTGITIVDNTVRWDYRPCDLIMDGATAAETKVLSTNWFKKIFRANKGIGAWIAIN